MHGDGAALLKVDQCENLNAAVHEPSVFKQAVVEHRVASFSELHDREVNSLVNACSLDERASLASDDESKVLFMSKALGSDHFPMM